MYFDNIRISVLKTHTRLLKKEALPLSVRAVWDFVNVRIFNYCHTEKSEKSSQIVGT